ncbi:MAG: mechanosensitive ion channel family protein, partial [Bacteroidota bacterium]
MKWYAQFIESTAAFLHISHLTLYKIIWSLVIIILFILARIIITRAFEQNITGVGKRYTARKSFTYITGFTALILIAGIWFVGGKNIVAYLGLLSAAIAIALREPIVNFAGWFYLLIRKPFSPGDRIEINAISGDVIDVELFKFSLMELGRREESDMSTGRIIHIPNGYAFRYSIANSTQGFRFIWHEIPVMVSFESNWKKAKEILQ